MAEKFKDIFFTDESLDKMAHAIQGAYSDFDIQQFDQMVKTKAFASKELKEKMWHVREVLFELLPENYPEAVKILEKSADKIKGFEALVLPDFVENYGQENWDISLNALRYFTRFSSSEFAIRPYIEKDKEKAMKFLLECSSNENHHVRRWASEGCRPRLPWASPLRDLIKDPKLILPILEKLKGDDNEYVRKSVANNINDISKDHPAQVIDLCRKWQGKSKNTDWIIKHGCRTLLKQGKKDAMMLFGFGNPKSIKVKEYKFEKETVKIGEEPHFLFKLEVNEKAPKKVRIEYKVHFVKANGKSSSKVFQVIEKVFEPGQHSIKRKHSFKERTTRKHYPGNHLVEIIVNGEKKGETNIVLKS